MTETATLAGGCFWCLEAVFEMLKGVSRVKSGYAGGAMERPTYEQVCSGTTGHAEVVQVEFDPAVIGYRDLLDVFFTIHDPTQLNRQGADVGTQYRSAIFPHSPDQEAAARSAIDAAGKSGVWDRPIVTTIEPLKAFWPAEAYHDQYYRRNANQPYCAFTVAPKVAKARKVFMSRLRKDAV